MSYSSRNPATGELVATFETISDGELDIALARSQAAYEEIRAWSFARRAKAMMAAASILEENIEGYAHLITLEMGKTIGAAAAEVQKCAHVCRFYAEQAETFLQREVIDVEQGEAFRAYLPMGTVLAVMPWNYPFWQVFRFAAPALMAGNAGLLKHASNVPQCALAIEKVFEQAGFPKGSFSTLLCSVEQIERVIADDRVRAATLTGSERAGMAVASACGKALKPTVLELGGSDPFIVMPSADLDAAVGAAVAARTQNCGQSCIAGKRFIVHAAIYDEFKRRFKEAFDRLVIGDPTDTSVDVGPLVSDQSRTEIVEQVRSAIADGASVVSGAESIPGPGYFFKPGILEGIPKCSKAYQEEIFGPVALLFEANGFDEAIEIANDTPFGLGSVIFSEDPQEQERAIVEIDAGSTFINSMTVSDPRLPFGGTKLSGYGRELSAEGIRAFCNIKAVKAL